MPCESISFSIHHFFFVLFSSSSSSSRQLSISITSLLLSFFFLHFFLLFCSILRWSSNNSARAIKAIFDQRLEEEMKIVDKTGCSQFYYVRRKSKLKKARENRNDIVPKWKKKKRRELHRRKKKEKKKGAIKAVFSFFLSFEASKKISIHSKRQDRNDKPYSFSFPYSFVSAIHVWYTVKSRNV